MVTQEKMPDKASKRLSKQTNLFPWLTYTTSAHCLAHCTEQHQGCFWPNPSLIHALNYNWYVGLYNHHRPLSLPWQGNPASQITTDCFSHAHNVAKASPWLTLLHRQLTRWSRVYTMLNMVYTIPKIVMKKITSWYLILMFVTTYHNVQVQQKTPILTLSGRKKTISIMWITQVFYQFASCPWLSLLFP